MIAGAGALLAACNDDHLPSPHNPGADTQPDSHPNCCITNNAGPHDLADSYCRYRARPGDQTITLWSSLCNAFAVTTIHPI